MGSCAPHEASADCVAQMVKQHAIHHHVYDEPGSALMFTIRTLHRLGAIRLEKSGGPKYLMYLTVAASSSHAEVLRLERIGYESSPVDC